MATRTRSRRRTSDYGDALPDDPRLEAAEDRLLRRERALEIVEEDPQRAFDLGIGRPDVRGAYHGELVDVNHTPAKVLTACPASTTSSHVAQ